MTPFTLCNNPGVPPPRSGSQSFERAIELLRALEAAGPNGAGVTDVAQDAGLAVSTAHRLLRALCTAGLAAQDHANGRYHLGPALVVLGQQAAKVLGYDQLLPVLNGLVAATGESANVGILVGGEVLVVLDAASPQPLRFDQDSGTRVPAHSSAMGKVMLAWCQDPVAAVASLTFERFTERTITGADNLLEELGAIRTRGWALNDGERNPGVRAVAAPILRADGSVGAALALQGPAIRFPDDRLEDLVNELLRATRAMSGFLT